MSKGVRRASQRSHLGGHKLAWGKGAAAPSNCYKQAPYWTYGSALAVSRLLTKRKVQWGCGNIEKCVVQLASDRDSYEAFQQELLGSQGDYEEARIGMGVVDYHMQQISNASSPKACLIKAKSLTRTMRNKVVAHDRVKEIEAPTPVPPTAGVDSLRSSDPSKDRCRTSHRCKSISEAVDRWGIGNEEGALVPERAKGRERTERGGRATPEQAARYVHSAALPPLTTNRSDQWYWPKEKRFFTVEEAARGCYVSEDSLLHAALGEGGGLSATEAISALGNGVHGAPFQHILKGALEDIENDGQTLTYGSGFTGIDTGAAAFDEVMKGRGQAWEYRYAAESESRLHAPLVKAWGQRGLSLEHVLSDVREMCQARLPRVDVLVLTMCCRAFSPRNHRPSRAGQAKSLADLHSAVRHARKTRPKRIILENVPTKTVTTAINTILGKAREYTWERSTLCPYKHFGFPSRRLRRYWVGRLKVVRRHRRHK